MSGAGGPDGNLEDIGRAMEVMGLVLASEARVRRYTETPAEAFEAMSLRELLFLASFGATLEGAGMYIDVPGVGKCAIK